MGQTYHTDRGSVPARGMSEHRRNGKRRVNGKISRQIEIQKVKRAFSLFASSPHARTVSGLLPVDHINDRRRSIVLAPEHGAVLFASHYVLVQPDGSTALCCTNKLCLKVSVA